MKTITKFALAAVLCLGMCASSDTAKAAVYEEVEALVSECTETQELYFENRELIDVVDMAMTCYQGFGSEQDTREYRWSDGILPSSPGGKYRSALYFLENDGNVLTIEFHGSAYGDSYNGIGIGFCLQLTQVGDDIYGQLLWTAGFRDANDNFEESWATVQNNPYQTACTNLKVTFENSNRKPRTVTFVGFNNVLLGTYTVPAGEWAAVAPTPPEVAGSIFYAWNKSFDVVTFDMTVEAIYHRLCTVTFMDADGETVLNTQIVEETNGAIAPDMTDRTYGGLPFAGWSTKFSHVTDDLVVTAVYSDLPVLVSEFIDDGRLPENGLVWDSIKPTGVWSDATSVWFDANKTRVTWTPGSTAVFISPAEVTIDGSLTIDGIQLFEDANVTFKGGSLNMTAPSVVMFNTNSVLRFENTVIGTDGLVITSTPDVNSTNACVEIAGDLALTGRVSISNALVRTVGEGKLGGGVFTQELNLLDDACLSLESSASQKMSGIITSTANNSYVITQPGSNVLFDGDKGMNWELRIAGNSSAEKYNTFPRDRYGVKVLAGGVLNMKNSLAEWGPQCWNYDNGLTIFPDGVVRLTHQNSLGVIMHTKIFGGLMTNEVVVSGTQLPPLVYHFYMKDGGRFAGNSVCVGYKSNYNSPSHITVTGNTPCFFEAESIILGYQTEPNPAKNQWVALDFRVSDVTGDDATDLTVSSRFVERPDGWKLCMDGGRDRVGFIKSDLGTVELLGSDSCCTQGVFRVDAGTVRVGETCSGKFGAFVLNGDATIDCAGGSMEFDVSSDQVWAEGATLMMTGDLESRALRFGTDANGLTREQLAQIKCEDPFKFAALSPSGYLSLSSPATVILMR